MSTLWVLPRPAEPQDEAGQVLGQSNLLLCLSPTHTLTKVGTYQSSIQTHHFKHTIQTCPTTLERRLGTADCVACSIHFPRPTNLIRPRLRSSASGSYE